MKSRSWIAGSLFALAVLAAAPDLPARHYAAREGRFLQRDPIRFAGGDVNLYAYAGGNPVNRIDPLGESCLSWIFGCGYRGRAADAFDASFGRSAIGKWEEVSAGAQVLWDDGPLESRRLLVDAMAQRYALVMIHQGEGRMYIVAANDLAGTTNLMEGVYGVDIAQERNLDKTERWERGLMGGCQTAMTFAGAQSSLSSLRAGYTGTGVRQLAVGLKDAGRWATTFERSSAGAIRSRILANVAENQAAIDASRIDVLFAKEAQARIGLHPDSFEFAVLQPGKILVRAGPRGRWYTDLETLTKSGFNRESYADLTQMRPNAVPREIGLYRVTKDIPSAQGTIGANVEFGAGQGWQSFIQYPNAQSSLVKIGSALLE